jgi:hypothetical protein
MRYKLLFFTLSCFINLQAYAQELSGQQLLKKAIAYHDPKGNWSSFQGKLEIETTPANKTVRASEVLINLPEQSFVLSTVKNEKKVVYDVGLNNTAFTLDGATTFSDEEIKTYGLTDARATFMKNYYTFLYGLPMKLTDPGTMIDPMVSKKEFEGKEYLVLKVKYEEGVGKDVWYFYFDPTTYAMQVYQFYHDETKNDGEYIVLSGEETFHDMHFPKSRAWYLNTDKRFLATDQLNEIKPL